MENRLIDDQPESLDDLVKKARSDDVLRAIIDEEENNRILKKLETVDLSDQEHSFIVKELLSPAGAEDIVAQVKSPEMAKMAYTVSLLAIEVDTDAERAYMNTLARQMNLNESDLNDIYRTLGIDKDGSSPDEL